MCGSRSATDLATGKKVLRVRKVLAILSLALGVMLLLFGFGLRTFLADPTDVRATVSETEDVTYLVVTGETLRSVPGEVAVTVEGAGQTVAIGATHDVTAWAEPFGYHEATYRPETATTDLKPHDPVTEPEADPAPAWRDPSGSDLWVEEHHTVEGETSLQLMPELRDDQALLIASAVDGPLAASVTLFWSDKLVTPWAGPLLTAGGLFSVLGMVLYVLAVDHDRRGLGPRRGRKGPLLGIRDSLTPRRSSRARGASRAPLTAVAAVGVFALMGCSAEYWPGSQPANEEPPVEEVAVSPITEVQLERIIADVSATSVAADEAKDASLLESRFAGDALEQRKANYRIRSEVGDYSVVPPYILNERLGYELIQGTDTWPRTMFIAVASAAEPPPPEETEPADDASDAPVEDADTETPEDTETASPTLGLLMTQADPQSNYVVTRVVSLRSGIEMPSAAPANEGTTVIDPATQSLRLAPEQVANAYANILNEGPESESAPLFNLEEDPVIAGGGTSWVAAEREQLEGQEGEATFASVSKQGSGSLTLSTGAGGALVFSTVTEERTTTAEEGSELPVGPVVAAISDLEGNTQHITQTITHQLLFFVPNQSSEDPIQLLGYSSELVGASE